MKKSWQHSLEAFAQPQLLDALKGIRRGIEKESLRVRENSRLATTGHPAGLGSPLTHEWITTDYAEAQMEFITPVSPEAGKAVEILADLHRHVYRYLGEELLWPVSMPCTILKEDEIALAYYGTSNVGRMKTVYRRGLKNRYGSIMQVIAGVHYNFSMPDSFWPVWQEIKGDRRPRQDFISASYFGLIRNFLRLGWLVPYLFGASPAVDSTFLNHARSPLPLASKGVSSHYLPNATSLRMSGLGYRAKEQENLDISYNSLVEFICGLRLATNQLNPVFEKIGLKREGEYQQLNANTLQEEGELYAPIRPKRTCQAGERLSEALQTNGVEYVEVRSLDLNPYAETGIDLEQVYFLDVFLTYCLLKDSPDLSGRQLRSAQQNLNKVAISGRDATLALLDGERPRLFRAWAEDIFSDLKGVARLLDSAEQGKKFEAALHCQHQKLTNSTLTLSARILRDMTERGMEVNELAVDLAKKHRRKLLETGYAQMQAKDFALAVEISRQKQRRLEETDSLGFDDFLRFTQERDPRAASSSINSGRDCCQWPALPEHRASCEIHH